MLVLSCQNYNKYGVDKKNVTEIMALYREWPCLCKIKDKSYLHKKLRKVEGFKENITYLKAKIWLILQFKRI